MVRKRLGTCDGPRCHARLGATGHLCGATSWLQAQPSAGLPVRARKADYLWAVAHYMVAVHDEVGHRDVRILDEFPKR